MHGTSSTASRLLLERDLPHIFDAAARFEQARDLCPTATFATHSKHGCRLKHSRSQSAFRPAAPSDSNLLKRMGPPNFQRPLYKEAPQWLTGGTVSLNSTSSRAPLPLTPCWLELSDELHCLPGFYVLGLPKCGVPVPRCQFRFWGCPKCGTHERVPG